MQLLSSENQNLPLKIPCKKVAWLLVGRKNTSVVRKACRSWITKSASRAKPNIQQTKPNTTKPNLQQTKPNTKSTNIQNKQIFQWLQKVEMPVGGGLGGWITKPGVPQRCWFYPLQKLQGTFPLSQILFKNFSFLRFSSTNLGNQEQHNPKNYSRHFRVTIH